MTRLGWGKSSSPSSLKCHQYYRQNEPRQGKLSPPAPGLDHQAEEPIETGPPHCQWRARNAARPEVEDAANANCQWNTQELLISSDPRFLLPGSEGDQNNVNSPSRSQSCHGLGIRGWIGRSGVRTGNLKIRVTRDDARGGKAGDSRCRTEEKEPITVGRAQSRDPLGKIGSRHLGPQRSAEQATGEK